MAETLTENSSLTTAFRITPSKWARIEAFRDTRGYATTSRALNALVQIGLDTVDKSPPPPPDPFGPAALTPRSA